MVLILVRYKFIQFYVGILKHDQICACGSEMIIGDSDSSRYEFSILWCCTRPKCYKKYYIRHGFLLCGLRLSLRAIYVMMVCWAK